MITNNSYIDKMKLISNQNDHICSDELSFFLYLIAVQFYFNGYSQLIHINES